MKAFLVTVRTATSKHKFQAIGRSSGDVHTSALDRFGGLCSVTVIPL